MGEYVPAHLAIEAMRDNGYRNTTYAVAELIDNSIQAGATLVELLCAEQQERVTSKSVRRISQIAVLDNGSGMDKEVLHIALQFGNGTRLTPSKRTGIGRFGMGLPASSISQCKKVEVWSWQNGVENALYTYLDVDKVKSGKTKVVPTPVRKAIPEMWRSVGKGFGKSGTLVVWSKLDRLLWRKASTLIDNSELLVGRIYRKFLDYSGNNADEYTHTVKIRMAYFDIDDPCSVVERYAKPNDPLYLMKNTSCPEPWDKKPMFQPLGGADNYEVRQIIKFNDKEHEVKIRFSYAKEEVRSSHPQAGSTPYGKHAAKNVGISIVRAGRELELDQSLVNPSDPRERWWGVEIEFPPALDELMGVTNNKQSARNLIDIMNYDFDKLITDGKTLQQIKQELQEVGDPRVPLFEVVSTTKRHLSVLRELIDKQRRGTRSKKKRHLDIKPQKKATLVTEERKKYGNWGLSDADESRPLDERKQNIMKDLVEHGVDEGEAEALSAEIVGNNLKYSFADAAMETDAFFTVSPMGGVINIYLNTKHPAYDNLVEVLEEDLEGADLEELKERLEKASEGLKLLLMAWARYEDELPDGKQKTTAQDARSDWGRVARQFLRGY